MAGNASAYPMNRARVAPAVPAADLRPVYLAAVLGYLLFLPPQFNLSIGGAVLPPYRIFLLPAALYVVSRSLKGRMSFGWPDYLVLIAVAWIALSLFMTTDAVEAISATIAQTCDIGLAYFFARCAFRSLRDLRHFLILIAPGLFVSGAIVFLEAISRMVILQRFASAVVGSPYAGEIAVRMGLMRAPGAFPHPILAGIFFSSFMPLYMWVGLRGWPKILGLLASLASFFTISSVAILAIAANFALVGYDWLSERYRQLTWKLPLAFMGILIFVAELGTNSGTFGLIVRFGGFNAHNSFYRILIWRFGSENVVQNPWFGIGYGEWVRPEWMPKSIDHYWLLLAVQYGILPPLLILAAVVTVIWKLSLKSASSPIIDRRAQRALAISLAVFAFGTLSVSIWLSAQIWFFMLLGICASISAPALQQRARQAFVGGYMMPPRVTGHLPASANARADFRDRA
jgi:O-antigen ligase